MSSVSDIKLQIKNWEHEFQRLHSRLPSKQDIKLDPKVYLLYKSYRTAKSGKETQSKRPSKRSTKVVEPVKEPEINIGFSDDNSEHENEAEDEETRTRHVRAELGPTPQANGKVLSIFDVRLTPPDSSPLKERKSQQLPAIKEGTASNVEFKTPTKLKRVPDLNHNSNAYQGRNLSEKLHSMVTPTKSDPPSFALETPQYLARNNRKFDFEISPVNKNVSASPNIDSSPVRKQYTAIIDGSSPFASDSEFETPVKVKRSFTSQDSVSPFISNNNNSPFETSSFQSQPAQSQESPFASIVTPVKNSTIGFSVSPSPLKTHRFLSKKLSDVFNDFKSIQEEAAAEAEEYEFDEEEEIEEASTTDGPKVNRKRKFTQKRTTRRWKIKPRLNDTGEDALEGKDIHKAIDKMNQKENEELKAYINSDEEEVEEEDSESEFVSKEPANTKGMVKPISMNYQRLKINDPRAKAFKKRMRR